MLTLYPMEEVLPHSTDELFQRLFRKHSSIMLLVDPETGEIKDANRAAANFYGYSEETLRSMNIGQLNVLPEPEIRAEMQRALEERRNYFEFAHRLANGEVRTVEVHSSAISAGERNLLFSIIFDVTERKLAEESLCVAALVYRSSSEAMIVIDRRGIIMGVNPAFTEITGYRADEAVGCHFSLLDSPRVTRKTQRAMRRALASGGRWQGETWGLRKDGRDFLCELSLFTVYGDDGRVLCRFGLFSDVTSKRETDELIWRQANFDALTELPNRSLLRERLGQTLKAARRRGHQVALLFLDLDFFKDVNDTLGHVMGDRLLQAVGRRLRECVGDAGTVGRLGGDEFTVILGVADKPAAEKLAQDILRAMAEPYAIEGEQVYTAASIGITFYPDDGGSVDELLKNADQAMYAAKAGGRNRFACFTRSMQEAALARKRLVSDLRRALQEGQLQLHYQPIVELDTGRVTKAEALLRWRHPERGMVSPAEFIPVAEATGLIVEIGDWVFREAARQSALWRKKIDPDFRVSVNVSPAQFLSGAGGVWLEYLREAGLPGEGLVVEITEGMLMEARTVIMDNLLALRAHGVQIALDDFGTGWSSLSYLKKFHIDFIKIDQSFVRNLAAEGEDLAVCEAIIVMARKLGIRLIAEGVETEQQRRILHENRCNYGQGYLFSKPVPAEVFESWMRLR